MPMDNSPVKFRRGNKDNLPESITDGYISMDTSEGQMYADIVEDGVEKRIAVNGSLFGMVTTDPHKPMKIVDIPGVPRYYDGLIFTIMFYSVDNTSTEPVYLSIVSNGTGLEYVPLMSSEDTTISGVDVDPLVPYTFVYVGGKMMMVTGSVSSRLKWKSMTYHQGQ